MGQINGFSRAQVELVAFKTRTDTHCAWLGSQISDKLVTSLAEQSDKLNGLRGKCVKAGWLVITGKSRRAAHWEVKHNGAGVYVRDGGEAGSLVGSVDLLKQVFGDAKIFATRAEAEKSFSGQKSFNPIVKAAKAETVKAAAKQDTKGKGKVPTVKAGKGLQMTSASKTGGKTVKRGKLSIGKK